MSDRISVGGEYSEKNMFFFLTFLCQCVDHVLCAFGWWTLDCMFYSCGNVRAVHTMGVSLNLENRVGKWYSKLGIIWFVCHMKSVFELRILFLCNCAGYLPWGWIRNRKGQWVWIDVVSAKSNGVSSFSEKNAWTWDRQYPISLYFSRF